jgi:hypothetical protein
MDCYIIKKKMAIKETYKPKETNVKKLEVFLNKLEKEKQL